MHTLLERQIKKNFKDITQFSPELRTFLQVISDTYDNYDKDRKFMEHSFDVSSREFADLNSKVLNLLEDLKVEKESVAQKVIERTKELDQKIEELNQNNILLKNREAQLTLANDRLTELDKVKSEFISVAAHQLRTPLSAIKWTLSLLIDEDSSNLNPEQRSLIMKGYESNERIIKLINEMLVVTRIESGKAQYTFTPMHIEDLINSVLLDFESLDTARKVRLSFEQPATELPYLIMDPEKIRNVIQNLIENALIYTPSGGSVILRAIQEGDAVKVSITDTGIGIPEHQKSSIFNKFFRADNATKVQTDGSGLGLFIAKSTVEKHGGTMSFDSKVGKGTTFFFTLPLKPAGVQSSA